MDRRLDTYESDSNPGRPLDAEWLKEVENRLAAYHSGERGAKIQGLANMMERDRKSVV